MTLFAIQPQGTTQIHDPSGDVIILPDDFGELKPRQICHISDENDVISFMQTSNGSIIECPINCEVVGNECVYPLSDEEIVRELQKGPQGLTQGEVAFVMKIVLSSTQVQEIIGERPYQTYCCGYEYNQTPPRHYYLLVSLNMNDKKEIVNALVDLQTLQVSKVETDVPWGGSGEPTVLPPLKQFKSGVAANDIVCRDNLQLVMKKSNGHPLCVKGTSTKKLTEIGFIHEYNSWDGEIDVDKIVPDDFRVSSVTNGLNTFDTQKNLYLPDMCDPPIQFKLDLSQQEKQQIWQSVKDNKFFELGGFGNEWCYPEYCVRVQPEIVVTLNITANGKTHSVTHDNSYIKTKNDGLDKFENIIETIGKIVSQKNELNNFTAPRCGLQ